MMDVFEIEEPNETITAPEKIEQTVERLPFLVDLNPEQLQAVEHTEGPLLVLSGAGTGKTRVLTTRTAYIIEKHLAKPYQILAVTFTNKAANEMKLRLEKMIGSAAFSVWLGTFHAIGVKILRKHAEKLNLTSDFTVLSADDQERLIKNILTERGIDVKKYDPATVLEIIQRWKDRGLLPQEVDFREKKSQISGLAFDSYQTYQNRLHTLNAVDFCCRLCFFGKIPMFWKNIRRDFVIFWLMNIKIPMSPNIYYCVCWRKSGIIFVVWVMMINPFIRGAAPKSVIF